MPAHPLADATMRVGAGHARAVKYLATNPPHTEVTTLSVEIPQE